jgi:excisionase family DNA binding protein
MRSRAEQVVMTAVLDATSTEPSPASAAVPAPTRTTSAARSRSREARAARDADAAVLTIDEAARLLRVNRKTLYDAVKLGRVPGVVRLGRSIRLGRAALLEWLQGNGGPALGGGR